MVANPTSRGSLEWLGAARKAVAITPAPATEFMPTRGLMVTVAGTVAVRFEGDNTDTAMTLLAGVYYPFSIKAVRDTGTAATGIIGFY